MNTDEDEHEGVDRAGAGIDEAGRLAALLSLAWSPASEERVERAIARAHVRTTAPPAFVVPTKRAAAFMTRWLSLAVLGGAALAGCSVGLARPELGELFVAQKRSNVIELLFAVDAAQP